MSEYENSITEQDLIDRAVEVDGGAFDDTNTAEKAIERLYCNGILDDIVGVEGSEPESAVLYINWILWTDSQGNNTAYEYDSSEDACAVFQDYADKVLGDEDYLSLQF